MVRKMHKEGNIREYLVKGSKLLRCGYTTGSCAAATAKASTTMLLAKKEIDTISLMTPKGILLELPIEEISRSEDRVKCAIVKDGGDDPDVTNGIFIYATVTKANHREIRIDGGMGIGRVTKPGLKVPIGEAAINPVPRRMICEAVEAVCKQYGYSGGIDILIEAPEGEKIAQKTFNSRLGILGGISILGTTGIVEPMSETAIIDTIHLEMQMKKANGVKHLVICPGNYGLDFLREHLGVAEQDVVKCSNFIGETLDYAVHLGFSSLTLVGHIGKLVKIGAGIMNTHSKYADGRVEVLCTHTALCGGTTELVEALWESVTTDEALRILKEAHMDHLVLPSIIKKIKYHMDYRVKEKLPIQVLLFSDTYGYLGHIEETNEVLEKIKEEYGK